MINYTATIFSESGSSIAPKLAAIVVAAIQLVGTLVSTQLVDRAGRKVTAAAAMRRGALIVCFFFIFCIPVLADRLFDRLGRQFADTGHLLVHECARLQCETVLLGGGEQLLGDAFPGVVRHHSVAVCGVGRNHARTGKVNAIMARELSVILTTPHLSRFAASVRRFVCASAGRWCLPW